MRPMEGTGEACGNLILLRHMAQRGFVFAVTFLP